MAKLRHDATFRIRWDCPNCGDTKWIAASRPGDPELKMDHAKLKCYTCGAQYTGPKIFLKREADEPEPEPAPAGG